NLAAAVGDAWSRTVENRMSVALGNDYLLIRSGISLCILERHSDRRSTHSVGDNGGGICADATGRGRRRNESDRGRLRQGTGAGYGGQSQGFRDRICYQEACRAIAHVARRVDRRDCGVRAGVCLQRYTLPAHSVEIAI